MHLAPIATRFTLGHALASAALAVACAVLDCLPVPAAATPLHSRIVEPGKALGDLRLGATLRDLEKSLGPPASHQPLSGQVIEYDWSIKARGRPDAADITALLRGGAVVQLSTDSSRYRTIHGVGAGATLQVLLSSDSGLVSRTFGVDDANLVTYDDAACGITGDFGIQDYPDNMDQARQWIKSTTLQEVTIHLPGCRLIPDTGCYATTDDELSPLKHPRLEPTETPSTLQPRFLYRALRGSAPAHPAV